jgi:hypothetical protein
MTTSIATRWDDATLASAITFAARAAGALAKGYPVTDSNPGNLDMRELNQHLPSDPNTDGRSSTAKFIHTLHKTPGRNLVKDHFAAGAANMRKTNSDRKAERDATARAERFIGVGDRLSLSDPHGDRLAKADKPAGTALDAIRNIHSRGPRRMAKGSSLPPQDAGNWDDERADDGATLAHDAAEADRAVSGIRQQTTPFGGPNSAPHASSVRGVPALVTQADGEKDPTVEAIKVSQRNPKPLTPGALRGDAQNANRDDSVR